MAKERKSRIKIKDLPKDMKIGGDELKRIRGGAYLSYIKLTTDESTYDTYLSSFLKMENVRRKK